VGGVYYYASHAQYTIPPEDFETTILVRETMTAMGSKTVRTVYESGQVEVVSDFPDSDESYILSAVEIAVIKSAITEAGTKIRNFEPKPGVRYEGMYRLETNFEGYRRHTTLDSALEKVSQGIKKAVVQEDRSE
jgi:hypothetical protein